MDPIKQYIEELCEATLYHGSPFPDIVECEEGICLAYSHKIAKDYAKYANWHDDIGIRSGDYSPTLYNVRVSDEIKIAREDDILSAAREIMRSGKNSANSIFKYLLNRDRSTLSRLSDIEDVRFLLRDKGFDAMEFTDVSPKHSDETGYSGSRHKTLRILNPSVVKVIGKKEVKW